MHTTSGLLANRCQHPGAMGWLALVLFILAVALVVALALVYVGEILSATTDPVQVAPFRWLRRA